MKPRTSARANGTLGGFPEVLFTQLWLTWANDDHERLLLLTSLMAPAALASRIRNGDPTRERVAKRHAVEWPA
ncbi:hypothetical protein OAX78_03885 [Planctomycetota bacterium]|nr:hypothetical protein [Planctomycetota bacterium]